MLFERKSFISHSGNLLHWKVECDALEKTDWNALAFMIAEKIEFSHVFGIPRGGTNLARALLPYTSPLQDKCYLIVDDVLTTGGSMEEYKKKVELAYPETCEIVGVVAFDRSRTVLPAWIRVVWRYDL